MSTAATAKPQPATVTRRGDANGTVKGTLVIARMKYLRARGPEDFERVLRRMSAADQQVLRGMLPPSSWYPADVVLRLEMTAAAILSRGERRQLSSTWDASPPTRTSAGAGSSAPI